MPHEFDGKLLHIVSDLLIDEGLRHWFNADPDRVCKRYRLGEDQKALLYTMKKEKMADWIREEIAGCDFPDDGFPRGPHCYGPFDGPNVLYPSPIPAIFHVSRVVASDSPQDLVVYGQSFDPSARIVIQRASDNQNIDPEPETTKRRGTYRCSELHTRITITRPGEHRVLLTNSPSSKYRETLKPFPFVVEGQPVGKGR